MRKKHQKPFACGYSKDYFTCEAESLQAITKLMRKKHQKKAPKKDTQVTVVRTKEYAINDSDLKLNWKTIKKVVPSTRSDHQKYKKCSDAFKHGVHYVGMAKFDDKESFTKEFMDSLEDNTPTDIEKQMKNNLVQVIKNAEKNYMSTITLTNKDRVLKFKDTLGTGAKE
eukprot:11715139-Ditylum_brightwellii.AAC.1